MLRAVGMPLTVEGLERLPAGKPAVIVVNHAKHFDAIVLPAVLPRGVHFAAKREFARMPLGRRRRIGAAAARNADPVDVGSCRKS